MPELINRLTRGDRLFAVPITPADAAALIVEELLAELPEERRNAVRDAIEKWGEAWGDLTAGNAYESMRD